jgi:hypothetical protein
MQLECRCFPWSNQANDSIVFTVQNVVIGVVETSFLEGVSILQDLRIDVSPIASDTRHDYGTKTLVC